MRPHDRNPGLDLRDRDLALLRDLLATHLPDAEVWAFGSRVDGGAHEDSDLDLVVRDTADPERPLPGTARLREALRDSVLPISVDVLEWAHLPPNFRTGIERRHLRIVPI